MFACCGAVCETRQSVCILPFTAYLYLSLSLLPVPLLLWREYMYNSDKKGLIFPSAFFPQMLANQRGLYRNLSL